MDPIMYQPSSSVDVALSAYLDDAEEDHFRLSSVLDDYFKSAKDTEVAFHLNLLSLYALEDPLLDANQYALATKRVYAQRNETRGRKAKYKPSRRNPAYVRAVRLWHINKLMAKALGIVYHEPLPPEPYSPVEETLVLQTYVETLDSIFRFEEFTGYTLPRAAYVVHTRSDRQALRRLSDLPIKNTDWVEEGVPAVKFEEYVVMREDPVLLDKIRRHLAPLKFEKSELEVFLKAA